MNEIKIYQNGGSINCDFETAKNELKSELELYGRTVFTEDTKVQAKNTVANLRKQKKAFQDEILRAKREYMKPFEEFQAKAGELLDLFDEPINYINKQIDDFELKRIEEKKKLINLIYEDIIEEEWRETLPLQKIYNSRWENATYTEKNIREDIFEVYKKVKDGINTLKLMQSDVEKEAIDIFLKTFDITPAILHITSYAKQKADILAREAKKEEERIRKEERDKIAAEQEKEKAVEVAKEEARAEMVEALTPTQTDEPEIIYTYRIKLTQDAKTKLEMYMDSVGIEYEE